MELRNVKAVHKNLSYNNDYNKNITYNSEETSCETIDDDKIISIDLFKLKNNRIKLLKSKENFTLLPSWTNKLYGAKLIFATDNYDESHTAENLLNNTNSWLTRRRRNPGHDWAVFKLPIPIYIRGIVISTANCIYGASSVSLSAAREITSNANNILESIAIEFPDMIVYENENYTVKQYPITYEFQQAVETHINTSFNWHEVLPITNLNYNEDTSCEIILPENSSDFKFDLLKLNLHPDGEIAQILVYGETLEGSQYSWKIEDTKNENQLQNYADIRKGSWILYATENIDDAPNILAPHPFGQESLLYKKNEVNWITPRNKLKNHEVLPIEQQLISFDGYNGDFVVIKLAVRCLVSRITVSTWSLKGEMPFGYKVLCVDRADLINLPLILQRKQFLTQISQDQLVCLATISSNDLIEDDEYNIEFDKMIMTHVIVFVHPDGGLNSIKVLGELLDN